MVNNPLSESIIEAIELDVFSTDIPSLISLDNVPYDPLKQKVKATPVSDVTAPGGVFAPNSLLLDFIASY